MRIRAVFFLLTLFYVNIVPIVLYIWKPPLAYVLGLNTRSQLNVSVPGVLKLNFDTFKIIYRLPIQTWRSSSLTYNIQERIISNCLVVKGQSFEFRNVDGKPPY